MTSLRVRRRAPTVLLLALLWAAGGAAAGDGIRAGIPLAEALERLRAGGLAVIYSSQLVRPTMRVLREPTAASPAARLSELLRPHGLRARWEPAGWYVVVAVGDSAAQPLATAPTPLPVARDEIFVTSPGRRIVDLTVRVVPGRRALDELEARNFVVRVGSRRQRVAAAERLEPAPASGAAPVVAAVPKVLLLFDRAVDSQARLERAKRAALGLLSATPADPGLIAIASLDEREGPWLEAAFTSDRRFARDVVAGLRLGGSPPLAADPLRIGGKPVVPAASAQRNPGFSAGTARLRSLVDRLAGETARDISLHRERTTLEGERSHRLARVDRLIWLARELAGLGGRKHLIFFSDTSDERDPVESAREDPVEPSDVWRVDSEELYGTSAYFSRYRRLADLLRAADTSFSLVDLREEALSRSGGLAWVADATGGLLIPTPSRLTASIERLVHLPDSCYRLAVELDRRAASEAWRHGFDVGLRRVAGGARALLAADPDRAFPARRRGVLGNQLARSSLVLSGDDGGELASSLRAVPLDAGPDGGPALIALEIGDLGAALDDAGSVLPLEIYLYAFAPDGRVVDSMAQLVELDVSRLGPALRRRGLRLLSRLRLVAGPQLLRLVALAGARHGIASFDITMPAAAPDEMLLLGPLFGDGRDGTPTVHVARAELPDPPCLRGLLELSVPAGGTPRLRRGEGRDVLLVGRNLPARPQVAGQLWSADGGAPAPAAFSVEALEPCPDGGPTLLSGTLSVGWARAGSYRLGLTVAGVSASTRIDVVE